MKEARKRWGSVKPDAVPRQTRVHIILFKGRHIELYSLSFLGEVIGRKVAAMRKWEDPKRGPHKLPGPIFKVKGGQSNWRWYSADEIEIYLANMLRYDTAPDFAGNISPFFKLTRAELKKLAEDIRFGRYEPQARLEPQRIRMIAETYQPMRMKRSGNEWTRKKKAKPNLSENDE